MSNTPSRTPIPLTRPIEPACCSTPRVEQEFVRTVNRCQPLLSSSSSPSCRQPSSSPFLVTSGPPSGYESPPLLGSSSSIISSGFFATAKAAPRKIVRRFSIFVPRSSFIDDVSFPDVFFFSLLTVSPFSRRPRPPPDSGSVFFPSDVTPPDIASSEIRDGSAFSQRAVASSFCSLAFSTLPERAVDSFN
ncbi:unnamed protein product [Linum trigynum]|uniref:Uncharacterized protein n=1 Tax=Linum trigynum TaxID=586398 RepID=A0AAV2F904_9ROSI